MPIWTTPLSGMADTRLEEPEHAALIESIRTALR
jgi:hypothetical protein